MLRLRCYLGTLLVTVGLCLAFSDEDSLMSLPREVGGENAPNEVPDIPKGVHFGKETSVEDLKNEIIEDMKKLDILQEKFKDEVDTQDMEAYKSIEKEVYQVFKDLQYKYDIYKQLLKITSDIETDLLKIEWKYSDLFPHPDTDHLTKDMKLDMDPPTNGTSQDNNEMEDEKPETGDLELDISEEDEEDDIEEDGVEEGGDDDGEDDGYPSEGEPGDTMEEVDETLRELEEFAEAETGLERRKRASGCRLVPQTDWAIGWTGTLKTNLGNGVTCANNLKSKAKRVKDAINDLHRIKMNLKKLRDGVTGLYYTLIPLSKMPYVGPTATTVKEAISPMKRALDSLYPKVERLDKKLYPSLRDKVAKLEQYAQTTANALTYGKNKVLTANTFLNRLGQCLCSMGNSSLRRSGISTSESACLRVKNASGRRPTDSTIATVMSACTLYDGMFDRLIRGMNLPSVNLGSFNIQLSNIIRKLGPFIDIFREIKIALDRRLCMPNPIEVTREAGERSLEWNRERGREIAKRAEKAREKVEDGREWTKKQAREKVEDGREWTKKQARKVGERAEEAKEAVGGWRRKKRSVDKVFLNKEQALDFFSKTLSRSTRASDICFSVSDILKGISSAFKFLRDWALRIINALLRRIPGINSLPKLPTLNINLNFLDSFNLSFDPYKFNIGLSWSFMPIPFSLPNGVCPAIG